VLAQQAPTAVAHILDGMARRLAAAATARSTAQYVTLSARATCAAASRTFCDACVGKIVHRCSVLTAFVALFGTDVSRVGISGRAPL
jgi:hypothetical protein